MKKRFTLRMHDYIDCPQGKLKYNKEMFKEIAPRYDFITRALSLGRDKRWKDELVARLPEIESPNCLDLACGTGDIAFRLADRYPRGYIVGLDLTEAMVAYAGLRNCHNNVKFIIQEMCRTQFADNSFDIVTGGYALRNAPDLKNALGEIQRVMKPGGTGAFLDFSKPSNRLFQQGENILLKIWCGFWGLILHRNTEVYIYIAESLKQFPDSEQLKEYITEAGFGNIWSKKYYLGVVETIAFEKPRGQNRQT